MRLSKLMVDNVRNLQKAELAFAPGINILVGQNGSGKTSLLEAVHLVARGQSFRSTRLERVIAHSAESLTITAHLAAETAGVATIGLYRHRHGEKLLRFNGQLATSLGDIVQTMPLQ